MAAPAVADPSPSPLPISAPAAVPPTTVCTIASNSTGAVELTGLVATGDGYAAVDGRNDVWGMRVVFLSKKCVRTSLRTYPGSGATDPQDIAVDSDGTYWIADTGDDPVSPTRDTVHLWKLTSASGSFTRYDFSYPDGPHNTEALLLDGDGSPIFVTKSIDGPAGIYSYSGKLSTSSTMTLTKSGTFAPEQTGTPNKLGDHGQAQNAVTGGATSPDGTHVALRTLTDAYEWDVTGGDVLAALKGKPRITRMPNEEQGYAIAYTTDGKNFVTVSDVNAPAPIQKYTPSSPSASPTKAGPKPPKTQAPPGFFRRWFNSLSLSDVMWLLGGIAAFGLLLVGIGIFGIRRARIRNAALARARARAGRGGGPGGGDGSGPGGRGPGGGPGAGGPGGGSGRAAAPVPTPVGGGTPGVYGAPRSPLPADPYGTPADPYGYPPPADPFGPGSGQGGRQYGGGQYGGGTYGAPVDPYQDGTQGYHEDRRRPDDGYGGYR
ncbi:MAG TPA: hypothetical protein VKB69_11285 [Micromonosporaceae bacterium]|nr:hypothetical protein [Micromonosporaceae bacterium]